MNIGEDDSSLVAQLGEQLTHYEDKLKNLEKVHGINQRWSVSSTEYREVKGFPLRIELAFY